MAAPNETPSTSPVTSAAVTVPSTSAQVAPEGFTAVIATITSSAGATCEVCLWLADTPDERGRGLMGVTDLAGAAGMVFVFGGPVVESFYMYRTPTPLSIAWFDETGSYVSSADMVPCLDVPPEECPRYAADRAYTTAVEVPAGGLDALGIGPGATIELSPDTGSTTCPMP